MNNLGEISVKIGRKRVNFSSARAFGIRGLALFSFDFSLREKVCVFASVHLPYFKLLGTQACTTSFSGDSYFKSLDIASVDCEQAANLVLTILEKWDAVVPENRSTIFS